MWELTHLKQGPGEGGIANDGEIMSAWLISYQGNQQRARPLTTLCSAQSLAGAWGKRVERSAPWVRWSRHCLSGCTKSKRTAILSGLTYTHFQSTDPPFPRCLSVTIFQTLFPFWPRLMFQWLHMSCKLPLFLSSLCKYLGSNNLRYIGFGLYSPSSPLRSLGDPGAFPASPLMVMRGCVAQPFSHSFIFIEKHKDNLLNYSAWCCDVSPNFPCVVSSV